MTRDWAATRLKYLVESIQTGVWGDEPRGDDDDVLCVRVADFDRRRLGLKPVETVRSVTEKDRAARLLRAGDILLEKSGGTEANPVGFTVMFQDDYPAVTSNFVARVRMRDDQHPRFWLYSLAASYSTRRTQKCVRQTTGIQNLDQDAFFSEVFAVPTLAEQTAIAAYLDRETARIDTLIEEQGQLLAMLRGRRRALIESAVFGGLEGAATCNNDEPWLPKTPSHWRVIQLGFVSETLAGYAFPGDAFSTDDTHVRLLRGVNVKPGRIDWSEAVYWDVEGSPVPRGFDLQAGDLVFGMDRPFVGSGVRIAAISADDLPALLLQRVMRIRPNDEGDRGYIRYVMATDAFFAYLEPLFTGVSVPHVSEWQVRKFKMPFPPIKEQRSIAAHLDRQTTAIDDLIAEVERFVELAQERRVALISAAVTGEIDVQSEVS